MPKSRLPQWVDTPKKLGGRGLVWPNGLTMDYEQTFSTGQMLICHVSLVILVGIDEISSSLFERRGIYHKHGEMLGEYTRED